MRTFLALARLALKRQFAYRAANLAGLLTNLFFGALRASVLIALFGARGEVAGYSVRDAVTFTGLTQGLVSFLQVFAWWDVIRSIRTGEVATDLARPVDYFWYWFAQDAGRAAGQLLLRGLPIFALYALAFPITWPPSAGHWTALAVSLPLALFVSFAWRFLVSLAAFWMQDAVGLGRAAWVVSMFLSGFLMPLRFFPDGLSGLIRLTPFPGMVTTPVEIYLGLLDGGALWAALAMQLAWCLGLYGLARLALAAGVRKLVIQGG